MIVPQFAATRGRMGEDLETRIRRALFGALALGAGIVFGVAGIHDYLYGLYNDRRAPLEDTVAYLGSAALLFLLATAVRSSRPSRHDFAAAMVWAIGGLAGTFAMFTIMMFLGGMFL